MYTPYTTEETFFVATKCCFLHEGKILIVSESRPGRPLWRELPGGKISKSDKDISPILSLKREVLEELGWDIDLDEEDTNLFHVEKRYEDATFSDAPVPFIFLCYLHELMHIPDITLSHEHSDFSWITESDIDTLDGDLDSMK